MRFDTPRRNVSLAGVASSDERHHQRKRIELACVGRHAQHQQSTTNRVRAAHSRRSLSAFNRVRQATMPQAAARAAHTREGYADSAPCPQAARSRWCRESGRNFDRSHSENTRATCCTGDGQTRLAKAQGRRSRSKADCIPRVRHAENTGSSSAMMPNTPGASSPFDMNPMPTPVPSQKPPSTGRRNLAPIRKRRAQIRSAMKYR